MLPMLPSAHPRLLHPARRPGALALLLAAIGLGLAVAPQGPATARQAQTGAQAWARSAVWNSGHAPESLLEPGGVAPGAGGSFLVADTGHDRVVTIDPNGATLSSFGGRGDGAAQLRAPRDLAVDLGRDRVYVVDSGNRRVAIFRLDGSPIGQWRSGGPSFGFAPHAVAVAPASGEVYVLSRLPWGFIDRFSATGAWLGGWGDTGSAPGQMEYPEDLAVLPDGRVAVADAGNGRLQIFSAGGLPVERVIPLAGVRAVAVDAAAGRLLALYPADAASAVLDRVAVFSADGSRQADLPPPPAGEAFAPARGLAVGGSRLAVASGGGAPDGRQGLRQLDLASGRLLAASLARPLDHPAFLAPAALDVAPDGSLLIIDAGLGVVRRLAAADGRPLALLDAGGGEDLTVAADGAVYVASAPVQGTVGLRKLTAAGARVWDKACDCLSGLGLAADGGAVYATDAMRRQLTVFDQDPGRRDPIRSHRPADAPYGWLIDLDLGPDGALWGVGGADRLVHRFEAANGRRIGGWEIAANQGGERISVAPDGTVFVLRADGQVAAFSAVGAPLGLIQPDPAPRRGHVRLRDIAAGAGGRLYAIDAVSESIFVYDPAGGGPPPTATPPGTPPCTVTGSKRAAPDIVTLGESVSIELGLDIQCRAGTQRQADIMLVLDRSSSMSGLKLDAARAAASRFVSQLDLSRHRAGLVSFSDLASLDQPLTADGAALRAVLDSIRSDGSTDIGTALERAQDHLAEAGRPGALPVLLLMTDGKPTRDGQPYIDALRTAARARGRGGLVYVVGLGDDVVTELLVAIAGDAERYFFAPSPDQLTGIYSQLSGTVGEVVATDLTLRDEMGADMRLDPASIQPPPAAQDAGSVTWQLPVAPAGGLRFSLRVTPQRTGRLPTNRLATASYTADGRRYSFDFAVPQVLVLGPASPTPPPVPGRVYLPVVLKEACLIKRQVGVDLVLALDSSSSMQGAKLAAAVAAARGLLAEMEPRTDRVGLVSFDGQARREYVITQDFEAVSRRLDQLVLSPGTRIDLGLEKSLGELESRGREGSRRAVVLLTDGRPSEGTEARALQLAALARASDVSLFTVGLGTDADGAFLGALARDSSYAYLAPRGEDLTAIYRRIAVSLPCR